MFLKLLRFIYNNFKNWNFIPSLLKYILIINEILNKIDNKRLYNLVVLKYTNI